MKRKSIRTMLHEKTRIVKTMFYLTATGILLLPRYASAAKKKEDAPVDPYAVVDNASSLVVYVGSAFAAAIGMYVLIGGIQEFSQARESHDTSTQMKAVAKVLAGALATMAGGIAAWMKANAN